MDVKEAIIKRRSIRKYLDKKISEEVINELIDAARLAPSAYNAQPWKFKIIKDKKIIQKLKEGSVFKNTFVYSVPVIIICCAIEKEYPERAKEKFNLKELSLGDVSIASQNLVLRATELGIGSCYVGLIDRDKLKKILNVPKEFVIPYVIALGYPDENPNPTSRKEINEILL